MKRVMLFMLAMATLTGAGYVTVGSNGAPRAQSPTRITVDGALHPEQIPDDVANRLYLVTVASMDPDVERAQLSAAGLTEEEISDAIRELASFKLSWDALRDNYNARVQSAQQYERTAFLRQRDALVAGALSHLRARLTTADFDRLSAHIEGEKRKMKVMIPH